MLTKTLGYIFLSVFVGYMALTTLGSSALAAANVAYGKYARNGDYLVIVDFTLPSNKKRLWVLDPNKKIIYHTYVAHGKNSGPGLYATQFSNKVGSLQSSLGAMRTGEPYKGKHGLSLTLKGLEDKNSNVEKRSVVIHGATYAEESYIKEKGRAGNSWGCLAVPLSQAKVIINTIKHGAVIYVYK